LDIADPRMLPKPILAWAQVPQRVITATVNFAAPARVPPAYIKLLVFPSFFSEHGFMPLKRACREDEYPNKINKMPRKISTCLVPAENERERLLADILPPMNFSEGDIFVKQKFPYIVNSVV
jgi:hypothetical protein